MQRDTFELLLVNTRKFLYSRFVFQNVLHQYNLEQQFFLLLCHRHLVHFQRTVLSYHSCLCWHIISCWFDLTGRCHHRTFSTRNFCGDSTSWCSCSGELNIVCNFKFLHARFIIIVIPRLPCPFLRNGMRANFNSRFNERSIKLFLDGFVYQFTTKTFDPDFWK